MVFLNGLLDGQALVRDFGIQPELDRLAEGRMVVLQGQDVISAGGYCQLIERRL